MLGEQRSPLRIVLLLRFGEYRRRRVRRSALWFACLVALPPSAVPHQPPPRLGIPEIAPVSGDQALGVVEIGAVLARRRSGGALRHLTSLLQWRARAHPASAFGRCV